MQQGCLLTLPGLGQTLILRLAAVTTTINMQLQNVSAGEITRAWSSAHSSLVTHWPSTIISQRAVNTMLFLHTTHGATRCSLAGVATRNNVRTRMHGRRRGGQLTTLLGLDMLRSIRAPPPGRRWLR